MKVPLDRDDARTFTMIAIYAMLSIGMVALLGLMVRLFLWAAFAPW